MGILIGFLIGILVLCALLLVLIILIQDDGSEGAGMIFGSAASQQYGVRKGNIVTRTTGILATVFMVLAFVLAFLLTDKDDSSSLQKLVEKKQEKSSQVKLWETDDDVSTSAETVIDENGEITGENIIAPASVTTESVDNDNAEETSPTKSESESELKDKNAQEDTASTSKNE